jgi:peroxiredoxin
MEPDKKTNLKSILGIAMILALMVDVVLLTLQNRELKSTIKSLSAASQVMEPLKPGDRVEPFKVQTLDGSMTTVAYFDPNRKYLLFVLSTTCPHCEKTLPAWKAMAKNSGNTCDVLGISIHSLDDTKKFVASKDVGFVTVSAKDDTSFSRKYKISGVPETILIDGNGVVEKAWIGELSSDQTAEIQNLMIASNAIAN